MPSALNKPSASKRPTKKSAQRSWPWPPSLLCLLLTSSACGARPPDWSFLDAIAIPQEGACGANLSGGDLVRLAYDGAPFAGLADPDPLPADAMQAAGSLGALRHIFPCATDPDEAIAQMIGAGYTELVLNSSSPKIYVFHGKDPVGVEGDYTRFLCSWVSDLHQDLDPPPPWSILSAGLGGVFTTPATPGEALDRMGEFSALAFRTGLIVPTPPLSAYLTRGPIFVAQAAALTKEPFPSENDPERRYLPLCATWVEHSIRNRCDRVYLGVSFNVLLDDLGAGFFQSVLVRQTLIGADKERGYKGWCGR